MILFFWIIIFCLSIFVLVKGADWFTESSEKIGLALKISPFIIGVTIVAIGTSLPELASGIAAVVKQNTEINVANVIGSNICNILLIIGLSAVFGGTLIIKRSLIDLDLPLLFFCSVLFIFFALDKKITGPEALILILSYLIYLAYTVTQRKDKQKEEKGLIYFFKRAWVYVSEKKPVAKKIQEERKPELIEVFPPEEKEKLTSKTFFFLALGGAMLYFGANYTIESLVKLATILAVPAGLIAIVALAVGTSLPELAVSVRTAAQKKYEISVGNIIGSCIFNILPILGITGLIGTLHLDEPTYHLGLPFLAVATLMLVISGISKKIHLWEGAMYLVIYIVFCGMLLGLF